MGDRGRRDQRETREAGLDPSAEKGYPEMAPTWETKKRVLGLCGGRQDTQPWHPSIVLHSPECHRGHLPGKVGTRLVTTPGRTGAGCLLAPGFPKRRCWC